MAITLLQPFNLDTAGNYTFNTLTANIKTDNLMYANGSPYVFSGNPAGTNTQVQFNDANSFGASAAFTFNKSSNVLTISGNLTSTNANLGNLVTANFVTGTLTTGAQPNITSTGTLSSLTVTGLVIATANGVKTANIYDSTGTLTIETKYGNSAGDAGVYGNLTVGTSGTGNITAYNANLGNLVIGNFLQGTLTTQAQPNITSVGTLSSLSVTANVSAGNVLTNNLLYANGVAWSFGSTYSNTNVAAYLPTYTGNIAANYFIGNGATLTNLTGGNVTGQVANALIAGTVYTNAQPNITSVGTLASLTVSGNANVSTNLNVTGNALVSGNLTVQGNTNYINVDTLVVEDPIIELGGGPNGAPLTTNDGKDRGTLLHYYTTAPVDAFMGWDNSNGEFAFGSNVSLSSEVVTFNSFGNVRASYFIGNGSQLTGVVGSANYSTFAGTVLTNAQPNITSVGTLASLTVTGNLTAGNANLGNLVIANFFSGNGSLLTSITGGNVSGQVGNALIAGTVYTNAQPNITSVGTLSSLTVTANISSGNANLGNLVTSNYFVGDGSLLSSIAAGNITGQVANALIAGTVYTNAQPNITSVGTLTSTTLAANSNITMSGSLSQISGANLIDATYLTGTLTTAAQPNVTSLGTLTGLTVSGNLSFTGANAYFSNISNVKIPGGSANYVIITDGSGNLSWAAQTGGGGGGTPGGSNTQLQFNDGGSFAGTANVTYDKTTNTLSVTGNASFTGANVSLGNIANLKITGGSNGYFLSTDGAGNLSWTQESVSALNITVDDFTGNGVQSNFTLSTTPVSEDFTIVSLAGTFQPRTTYTVSGNVISFSSAPPNNAPIEVTTFAGYAATPAVYTTRTYTGNGSQTVFTVTSGSSVDSLLVTENGVLQVPTTDYTVAGASLTFTTAPSSNVAIQVRELPTSLGGAGGLTWNIANANATMSASNGYFVDTSAGAKTMTLPASASLGDTIRINDLAGTFGSNACTINRNGHNIQGVADDLVANTAQASFGLVYSNSTYGWKILEVV